ncbi:ABC transporter substrate-binding protein [Elstera sp.]|jgi:peptide/nickel transport system substrate-binding protein|uniref:ABC transporter substrate-binding protein n=1 Tax=Elstera sp. TaxID=1916664 RepID=UPI0037C093E3
MMNFRWMRPLALGIGLTATLIGGSALAQAPDLIIARGNEPVSMDPQFARTGNNQMTAAHVFERLAGVDENMRATQQLALAWKALSPLVWEVKLRPGVTFHDGSPFTAEDVVFSLQRPPTIPNSPASFAPSVAGIEKMEIIDPLTLKITSKTPDPLFVNEIGRVFIVSKKAAEGASNDQFNKGTATIGTGPYKFVDWTPGGQLNLVRYDGYWGKKAEFERVQLRFISNAASRVAALKAGDVQMIDLVPPNFVEELKKDANIQVAEADSLRLIYLALDSARDVSPFLTDIDGKPLTSNPLKDVRVRQALSKLIDRPRLIERVLTNAGTASGQMVPEGVFGYNPDLKPTAFDPEGAKKLLADAGWAKGFGITLHGSNDRFAQDSNVTQTIGQLFARGGLKVNGIQSLPYSVFAKAATAGEYSAFLFSYGSTTGEASAGLDSVLHTYDKEKGLGGNNRTRYSNPNFDLLLEQGMAEFDDEKREILLRFAAKAAFEDVGIIPLYWQKVAWATRKGFVYQGRRDEHTVAMNVSRQ